MASILMFNPNYFDTYDTIEAARGPFLLSEDYKRIKGFYIYGYNAQYVGPMFNDVAMAVKGKENPIYLNGEYVLCSTRMVLTEKYAISSKALDNWIPF